MPLAQMPLDCDSHVTADWFEFHVLYSEYGFGLLSDLKRSWDKRKNTEATAPDGEPLILSDPDEAFQDEVVEQFRQRIRFLGPDYPFQFNDTGEELLIKTDLSKGSTLYLFCLFLSHSKSSEVFELDKYSYELTNAVRDLFQACCTWAAAGVSNGCSISFGFPRPDGTNFIDKLKQTYALFGEGDVRDVPKKGVSTNPKDAGIDIVAWTPRADQGAGTFYMLGQVASGHNWAGKSVMEYIKPLHKDWFSDAPSSTTTPAMFTPFCVDLVGGANLKQQIDILTTKYGNFYYRYIIPTMAQKGLDLAESVSDLTIERTDDYLYINQWVEERIARLKAVASV